MTIEHERLPGENGHRGTGRYASSCAVNPARHVGSFGDPERSCKSEDQQAPWYTYAGIYNVFCLKNTLLRLMFVSDLSLRRGGSTKAARLSFGVG